MQNELYHIPEPEVQEPEQPSTEVYSGVSAIGEVVADAMDSRHALEEARLFAAAAHRVELDRVPLVSAEQAGARCAMTLGVWVLELRTRATSRGMVVDDNGSHRLPPHDSMGKAA